MQSFCLLLSCCLPSIAQGLLAKSKPRYAGSTTGPSFVSATHTMDWVDGKDAVLADPETKEAMTIWARPVSPVAEEYEFHSSTNTYKGRSDGFIDLLQPMHECEETTAKRKADPNNNQVVTFLKKIAGLSHAEDGILMRDFITSTFMSSLYERGWRQTFYFAGFPGPDEEAALAMEYFQSSMDHATKHGESHVLVDMSCASGLFTRRFAQSGKYDRVVGCDYSASMLSEARRRIQADNQIGRPSVTPLDLVRCDVGNIPMQNESIPAFHAGAALHCWPDLVAAVSEIHRVLKPGGRFFATTFLADYFRFLANRDADLSFNQQALHYFESREDIVELLQSGGFDPSNISIEVLGKACVVIRCEK